MVRRGHLQRRMVFVHSDLSWRAPPGSVRDRYRRLLWHLPISFCVSGFIAITHTFFLVEPASHWGLFPVLFRDARADLTPNIFTLSLRGRGIMWAISRRSVQLRRSCC